MDEKKLLIVLTHNYRGVIFKNQKSQGFFVLKKNLITLLQIMPNKEASLTTQELVTFAAFRTNSLTLHTIYYHFLATTLCTIDSAISFEKLMCTVINNNATVEIYNL